MLFKGIAVICFLAISAFAQHHGATSYVSSSLGGHSNQGYTHQSGSYLSTPQYYSAPITTYLKKYSVAPIVPKIPVVAYKKYEEEEHYGPAKYEFKYAVEDKHTGDIKSQQEVRDGDVVKGEYSLHEADGTIRTVKYTVDKHSGFNAVVERSGHAAHPQVVPIKKVHQVPVQFGHGLGYYH